MDIGLLVIRVVVGLFLAAHGIQKLSHRLDGHGIEGTAAFHGQLGFRPAKAMAWVSALTETGAGLALALGFLTPFAGAGIIGQMTVAAWVAHRQNGPWVSQGGYEYNTVLAAVGAGLAFTGPGAVSLDHGLGIDLSGSGWGAFAVVLGLVAATSVLASRSTATGAAAAETVPPVVEAEAAA